MDGELETAWMEDCCWKAGHPGNEAADQLANEAMDALAAGVRG